MLVNAESETRCPKWVPDCDPPFIYKIVSSFFAMLALFYASDMAFYTAFSETYSGDGMRETPLLVNMLVGYIIASSLFVLIYIYYGRPPRNEEKESSYRSRTQKGWSYGFIVASVVFIPSLFIRSGVEVDFDIANSLLEGLFHIVQFMAGGVMIAHILGTPPRSVEEKD